MKSFRIAPLFVRSLFVVVVTVAATVTAVHLGTNVKTEYSPVVENDDGIRWELLQNIADQTGQRLAKMPDAVSQDDHNLLSYWLIYQWSPRSEKSQTVEGIRAELKSKAEMDVAFRMIDVLLFGPPHGLIVSEYTEPVEPDQNCFSSTLDLLEKHCGRVFRYSSLYGATIEKICDNSVDRYAVEEAFKVACRKESLGVTSHEDEDETADGPIWFPEILNY